MKIYKKIVYDKDDNIIESESYEYHGEVAQAGGSVKKIIVKRLGELNNENL